MSRTPFTEDQVKQVRSMSLYWDEIRKRDNAADAIAHESAVVHEMLRGYRIFAAAEFCVDPIRLAAPELLWACEAMLLLMPKTAQVVNDDSTVLDTYRQIDVGAIKDRARAAIDKAKSE